MTQDQTLFDTKVAELLAVTKGLGVPQILLLRRMTLADPETRKWAGERELSVVFNVILTQAVDSMDLDALDEASNQGFDPLLPPGSDDDRDRDRWMLFDLARKRLACRPKSPAAAEAEEALAEEVPDDSPVVADDFATLFDETLARYARRTLAALATRATRPHIPTPFIIAPGFAPTFELMLRKVILPDLRSMRRIKELAAAHDWTGEAASPRLIAMMEKGGTDNPILAPWDSRWNALRTEGEPDPKGKPRRKWSGDPFAVLSEGAARFGFEPPTAADLGLLERIIRWVPEEVARAWGEVAQVYQQEFHPKSRSDQARQGAFRDSLIRWIEKLPHHAGDVVTIRAFFELPKCDRMFLRQLIQSMGSSDTVRRRMAPVLIHFFETLPK